MEESKTLLTWYSTLGLLYLIRGRFSCKKCLGKKQLTCADQKKDRSILSFYLAPALSFLPFKAKVKAILETLGDNLAAPGPEVKCFKISRVLCAALNDIVKRLNMEIKKKKERKIEIIFDQGTKR